MNIETLHREPIGGPFTVILIVDESRTDAERFAVLVESAPEGTDMSEWRVSQPYPDPELGRPLVAEAFESGMVGIADWEEERSARRRLNKLVVESQRMERRTRELLGLPPSDE